MGEKPKTEKTVLVYLGRSPKGTIFIGVNDPRNNSPACELIGVQSITVTEGQGLAK